MVQTTKDIPSFIKETIERLKQTSPVFFKWWGRVNVALIFIGGIPVALQYIQTKYGIDFNSILPHAEWVQNSLKIMASAGVWGKIMTSMTVVKRTETVTDGDVTIQKVLPEFPFTEKKEPAKIIEANNIVIPK